MGLLAMFVVMVGTLLIGFFLRTLHHYDAPRDKSIHSRGRWGFFNRNNRRAERMPCDLKLELLDRTAYVTTGTGRLLNLSTTGACLKSRVTLSLGERVQGRVQSEANERIHISGYIVWIKPGSMGTFYGLQFR